MARIIWFALLFCWFSVSGPVIRAQVISVYDVLNRPPGITYRVLDAGPYEIIFQEGNRKQAEEVLWTLQTTFGATDSLVGDGSPPHLSVVLNAYNDRGNGYVSSFPFKSEIESAALTGRGLALTNTNWTRTVTAHELVHAVQADARTGWGVSAIVRPFAPDLARSMNMWMPKGWLEGLAVHRESEFEGKGGRLNHPYFTMQFRAGMDTGKGWTLAEMLEPPDYHRPFNRFYLGGSLFTEFLLDTYGVEAVRQSAKWQGRFPLLGFGAVLRLSTGDWPWHVRRNMRQWYDSTWQYTVPDRSFDRNRHGRTGLVHRNPRWLDDTTLVVYAFAYNLARGFFTWDVERESLDRISMQETTEDAAFSVSTDGRILFSRYQRHPVSPITFTSASFSLDVDTGQDVLIPHSAHTYNPVRLPNGALWGIRTRGAWSDIVSLEADSVHTVVSYPRVRIESIAPRPLSDSVAVVANAAGHQALFLVDDARLVPWLGFENASIYDASWNADGSWLAFTADLGGTLQVYVMAAGTEHIYRMTDDAYAAMEPDVSPDGRRLAYVSYRDERFDLMVVPLDLNKAEPVNRDMANHTWLTDWEAVDEVPSWDGPDKPYSSLSRISPRSLFPTVYMGADRDRPNDARLGLGLGLGAQGTDPLQLFSWYGEGFVQKSRVWGEVGISYGGWSIFPVARFSRRPETVQALNSRSESTRAIRDRTSASFGLVMPRTFEQNVAASSMRVGLFLAWRHDRVLNDELLQITPSFKRWSFTPSMTWAYRVQRNPRDMMPRTGSVLRWIGEFDLEAERFSKRRAWIARFDQYVPIGGRFNTGVQLTTGVLHQNVASAFNLDGFRPRGWEDGFVGSGDFIRYGMEIRQPVLFVDNGFMIVPAYLRAVFLYGFAERLHDARAWDEHFGSAGFGLGVQLKAFHIIDLELRWRWAYRFEDQRWVRDFTLIDPLQ